MCVGTLHQTDYLRHGALAEALCGLHAEHTGKVHAARYDLVVLRNITRHRLAGERNGVERRLAFYDASVQRHFLAWLYHYRLANLHIRRRYNDEFAAALYGRRVGTYIHKVGYAVATLALGVAFKQFAYLEEQHHEDCFGKLGLCTWQETDTERTDCGNGHKEMLVEHVAADDALKCFLQRIVTDKKIRHEVNQQQLPRRQTAILLYNYCADKQQRSKNDKQQCALHAVMLMVVMMMFMIVMLMFVMTLVTMPTTAVVGMVIVFLFHFTCILKHFYLYFLNIAKVWR